MTESKPGLILYTRDYCMYCNRVLQAAQQLAIDMEIRNIWQRDQYEAELVGATGRSVVPVLKIEKENGKHTWMPESADIVRYLQARSAA